MTVWIIGPALMRLSRIGGGPAAARGGWVGPSRLPARRATPAPASPLPAAALRSAASSWLGQAAGMCHSAAVAAAAGQRRAWGPVCAAATGIAMAASPAATAECAGGSVLAGREDNFGGIIVDAEELPSEPSEFVDRMALSLREWAAGGKRGIWLKVPVEKASLISGAVELGFELHHAEKPYVMMTQWLASSESTIPVNASHQVGIGAIVLNGKGDILVVQEKNGPLKGQGVWKMPTGIIHAGEDLSTGAEREVLEETAVDAAFESILCFRHAHGVAHGKSDLFFVCLLREKGEPRAIRPCETEIEAARWMPMHEYLTLGWYKEGSVYTRIMEVIERASRREYTAGYVAEELPIGFRPGDNFLYHGAADLKGTGASPQVTEAF